MIVFETVVKQWCDIKNNLYNGQAGLQLSINSTSEQQRNQMFGDCSLSLKEIAAIVEKLPTPIGRKYCLNFAYSTDFEVDASVVANLFDSEKFMCKITPIHNCNACVENGIKTEGGYVSYLPYKKPETALKEAGFDVLVFIPSQDEEDSCITCGNVVLGGSEIKFMKK